MIPDQHVAGAAVASQGGALAAMVARHPHATTVSGP